MHHFRPTRTHITEVWNMVDIADAPVHIWDVTWFQSFAFELAEVLSGRRYWQFLVWAVDNTISEEWFFPLLLIVNMWPEWEAH